jgi:methylaspartate ammonia-lyase
MRVAEAFVTPIAGGFFHDDLAAVRAGAVHDGQAYVGEPRTPGFAEIRVPARGLGIGLRLDDGSVVWGDAVTVQHAGAGGREPVLTADERTAARLGAFLRGREVIGFREGLPGVLEAAGGSLALSYGLSQAWAAAVAAVRRRTICEVLCDEYDLPQPTGPVPVYAQSGDDRYGNADKMIMKRVDALPHALINNVGLLGPGGAKLREYVSWLAARIARLAGPGYRPTVHLDLYGTAGLEFGNDAGRIADYLQLLGKVAAPFPLRIESPVDLGSRDRQIAGLATLRAELRERGSTVELVADEWCNTLDDVRAFIAADACDLIQIKTPDLGSIENSLYAVRLCREAGIGAVLGGSCAETEVSARVSVHLALAARPDVQLAKPGMGVDEGLMLVRNEQARVLAVLGNR